MVDSLEIESGRALREFRGRAEAASELAATLADLDTAGVTAKEGFRVADGKFATGEIRSKIGLARQKLAENRATAAAAKRREAVPSGRAALVYEVTQGMATSWVEDRSVGDPHPVDNDQTRVPHQDLGEPAFEERRA